MSNAYDKLKRTIHEAIKGQVAYMLADPGPFIGDTDAAAEHLTLLAVGALTQPESPADIGGWMIKRYGAAPVYEVIEFDMRDSYEGGWVWEVFTKSNDEDEGDE